MLLGEVLAQRAVQPRDRHPPGLSNGRLTTRQRRGPQVPDAPRPGEVGDEQLAAPQGAVCAETRTVVSDPEDRPGDPVLDQARRDVGVVVLHRHHRQTGLPRPRRRAQVRVQVVRDDGRNEPAEP